MLSLTGKEMQILFRTIVPGREKLFVATQVRQAAENDKARVSGAFYPVFLIDLEKFESSPSFPGMILKKSIFEDAGGV